MCCVCIVRDRMSYRMIQMGNDLMGLALEKLELPARKQA